MSASFNREGSRIRCTFSLLCDVPSARTMTVVTFSENVIIRDNTVLGYER